MTSNLTNLIEETFKELEEWEAWNEFKSYALDNGKFAEDIIRKSLLSISQEAIRGRNQEIWEALEKMRLHFDEVDKEWENGYSVGIGDAQSLVNKEKTL